MVTIHGQGEGTGKTAFQFRLASLLAKLGHEVFLSDSKASPKIMEMYLNEAKMGLPDSFVPMSVHLHVSDSVLSLSEFVGDRTQLKW